MTAIVRFIPIMISIVIIAIEGIARNPSSIKRWIISLCMLLVGFSVIIFAVI